MTTALAAPPIPGWSLAHPERTPSLGFTAALPVANLAERHRPRTLADLVGQADAVARLRSFLAAPCSKAFLLSGPTGTGKTTAARALANDLGVDPDWGLYEIRSAEADYEAVDRALRMLRHACPAGSGYKLVVVDEADLMSPKASHTWLSALEDLPPHSVVVFTTNDPHKFPDRFRDRCEHIDFAADGSDLSDAQTLIDRVWRAETGADDAPRAATLPNLLDRDGRVSYRRAVSALDATIRDRAGPLAPLPAPTRLAQRETAPTASTGPLDAPEPAPEPVPPPPALPALPAPAVIPFRRSLAIVDPPRPKRKPRKPKPAPAPLPMTVGSDLGRVRAELDRLDAEYQRIGERAVAIDARRAELKRMAKRLDPKPRRK